MAAALAQAALLIVWCATAASQGLPPDPDPEDIEVSYIYAAVMGSGTYTIKDRRITMFRLPLSYRQREATETSSGARWLLPVVVGYDDLSAVDSEWLEALLPSQLVTLTALPGFEYVHPLSERWQIKPFIQLGGGRDFSSGESFAMAQAGVRSLSVFAVADQWTLRWGNTVRFAAEYQFQSDDRVSFGVFDSGLDLRRDMPFRLFDKPVDIGAYYIFQRFMPEWDIGRAPDRKFETQNLNELGLSIGLKKKHKVLGIPFKRIRIGYKKGGSFSGWTFGTEFPY
jgi:hypothetical protein